MIIIDFIADFFLYFNREIIVMPLIGIGYWVYRPRLFSHVLFLILLSMIVNTFLKCLFQVPLKPHLNQQGWYAFPSGHMQLATVLYGRLWWEFRKTKWAQLLLALLGGIAWAMIWKNYHDFIDVAAGVIVGIGLLLGYSVFVSWRPVYNHPERTGFFLLPLTSLLIVFMPSIPQHMAHVWNAQGGILGFTVGLVLLSFTNTIKINVSRWVSVLKVILGLGVFVVCSFSNKLLFGGLGYPWFPFLAFFINGLWLSAGPDFVASCLLRRQPLA